LADYEEGLIKLCQQMRQVPAIFEDPKGPSGRVMADGQSVAIRYLGDDLIRKLPMAKVDFVFAIVAMDYFTKRVEVEAITKFTSSMILSFVKKNIMCRHSVPMQIITDNGTQFESKEFVDFCNHYRIKKSFSSVVHSQTNGQVEAINKILKDIVKKRLERTKGNWAEELLTALWVYRTTYRTATGHSPFALLTVQKRCSRWR